MDLRTENIFQIYPTYNAAKCMQHKCYCSCCCFTPDCFSPGSLPHPSWVHREGWYFYFSYHPLSRVFILAQHGWPVVSLYSKTLVCRFTPKLTTCIIIIRPQKGIHLRLSPTVSHTLVIAVIKIISRLTWAKTNCVVILIAWYQAGSGRVGYFFW